MSTPREPASWPAAWRASAPVSDASAGTTADTWARRGHFAYNNIARVLAGEPPVALVGQIKAVRPAQA